MAVLPLPYVYTEEELRNICDEEKFILGVLGLQNNSIIRLDLRNILIIIRYF